MLFRDFGNSVI